MQLKVVAGKGSRDRFKKWNVYAKAPFGSPDRVVEYLGRYTHKIAITRHRILEVNDSHIRFSYKDYADGSRTKQMLLPHQEFLRRFEQHILPKRFVKIRHFGYLRLQRKGERLAQIRSSMNMEPEKPKVKIPFQIRMLEKYGRDIFKCPCCKTGRMTVFFDTRDKANRKPKPIRSTPAPS